ncbi:MAG: hypothetical protein COB17_07790 [Sulfurimonas sp.]|nr:MAG: hypothetical protein COB17_07790 [Sulfurimonas sp.]
MDKKIENILKIWHERFSNEENQYSEFEDSDIEYFVGCLLYNHFNFTSSLDSMKTIDLSYDFISGCGNEYDDILASIKSINFEDEADSIAFLQNFLKEASFKYTSDESYLLNRLSFHINEITLRFSSDNKVDKVKFEAPVKKSSSNPLDRI